ncbi:hypothetical protein A2954_07175 [Candidatus Roizmanbacteria bacterium RIFCSPLOWO2_01_FULL_37_12]|uniref:DUF6883 domain-containing protein n=1 Tax=Candidatus Roizmanbacteria bacterium RIFCSPLOWO2_01_FULL_37_12 TaxID=1802056 RepID=A0A1F7IE52_9BACT|nr:MAG: hypothetical protein A3D76_01090 [Candidatus Roizmanbacteria bacterium RIFCSPHIGHO2_02_FULL_37_9b]OGK41634.1 MAG: hypothetical protein A2954_07175 [Candidatus Roizmanbacteria bacterium RIFCSPLOWO2_01_FULL_37_12]
MKLHFKEIPIISRKKLTDYILSETHATGKFKAKFFRSLGFNETNIVIFEKELRKLFKYQEIKDAEISPYGTKYIIDGEIKTPIKKAVKIRTIWIIEKGQKRPRFITIYPV